jgi:phospholipid/cholesterol/gamma-HCH transport system substrate-binding protein
VDVLLKDADPRFRRLGLKIGLYSGGVTLLLLALAAMLAARKGFFEDKTHLYTVADRGNGLSAGMEVRFSGFRIGVVDRVALNEKAKVNIDLLVETRYLKWIKPDSKATLYQDGMIGDYIIEIVGGSARAAPVKEGAVLALDKPPGVADIALDLRDRVVPIIDSVQETLDYVNNPQGDVRQTLANVQLLTAELRETRTRVDQLLVRVDGLADHEVRGAIRNADRSLTRIESIASEVESRVPGLMNQVASSLAEVEAASRNANEMTATLKNAVNQTAPQLPKAVRHADTLIRNSNDTLDGLRKSWPLKNMVPAGELEAPVPDSRAGGAP